MIKGLIKKVMNGTRLLSSELIELYTLLGDSSIEEFQVAFRLLIRAKAVAEIPEFLYDEAVRTVWRRAIMREK